MSIPRPASRILYSHQPSHGPSKVREETSEPNTPSRPGLFETLRQEMRLRNYSAKTIKAYLSCIRSLARHFAPRNPRELSDEDLRAYLLYLIEQEEYAASTINQVINMLRFLHVELHKRLSTKTTEIYTPVSRRSIEQIKSPIDQLYKPKVE